MPNNNESQSSITDEQIQEWLAMRGEGMASAVGEYTPAEFWQVLDELARLRRQEAEFDAAVSISDDVIKKFEATLMAQTFRALDLLGRP